MGGMLRKDFVEDVGFDQVLPEGQSSAAGKERAWSVRSDG